MAKSAASDRERAQQGRVRRRGQVKFSWFRHYPRELPHQKAARRTAWFVSGAQMHEQLSPGVPASLITGLKRSYVTSTQMGHFRLWERLVCPSAITAAVLDRFIRCDVSSCVDLTSRGCRSSLEGLNCALAIAFLCNPDKESIPFDATHVDSACISYVRSSCRGGRTVASSCRQRRGSSLCRGTCNWSSRISPGIAPST